MSAVDFALLVAASIGFGAVGLFIIQTICEYRKNHPKTKTFRYMVL